MVEKLFILLFLLSLIYGFKNRNLSIEEIDNEYQIEFDHKGRLISEGNYKNGLKDARWCYYFLIDSIFENKFDQIAYAREQLVRKEGYFNQGNQSNYWNCYYSNGNKEAEGWFINGQKVRFWKYYDVEGLAVSEGHYLKGEKDGWWREFLPQQSIMKKGKYQKGMKSGYWQKYQEEELIAVSKFDMGIHVATWTSYEDYLNWKKD